MSRLNFGRGAVDNPGVDQVSRPMQIALVAVVLLAGMWFTVLKPKPDSGSDFQPTAAKARPGAPGVKGLAKAVGAAKGAAATSDAANAKVQAATGSAAKPAAAKATLTAKPKATAPAATAKPAVKPAAA